MYRNVFYRNRIAIHLPYTLSPVYYIEHNCLNKCLDIIYIGLEVNYLQSFFYWQYCFGIEDVFN